MGMSCFASAIQPISLSIYLKALKTPLHEANIKYNPSYQTTIYHFKKKYNLKTQKNE
jgi:hypothetical protein